MSAGVMSAESPLSDCSGDEEEHEQMTKANSRRKRCRIICKQVKSEYRVKNREYAGKDETIILNVCEHLY